MTVAELKKVLPIPEGQQVGAVIPVGYPTEAEISAPSRKEADELISFV